MAIKLDSSRVAADDRAQAVLEALAEHKVPVAVETRRETITRGTFTDVGDLRICSVRSNAAWVKRSERMTRDSAEPSVFLAMQHSGSSLVMQDDRETVLRPGDLVLFDSTSAFTLVDDAGIRGWQIKIPVSEFGVPMPVLRKVTATNLSPEHPTAKLASGYFRHMAAHPPQLSESDGLTLSRPSIALIRALIDTHLYATADLRESLHETLALRILEFARTHLHDPDLTPRLVAAEFNISVRQLYKVLGDNDISLATWIRTERLKGSRLDLARSDTDLPIGAVARRWGFADPSTFARLFRAAYDMTPREWRASSRG